MTFRNLFSGFFALLAIASLTSCGNDDDATPSMETFNLNLTRLTDLGADFKYEGWLIVDGAPVSTGTFTVDANGNSSQTSFEATPDNWSKATAFVLSIEPAQDSDPAPSAVKILGGDFNNGTATLSVAHAAALGTDFSTAAGSYILATPTNGMMTDELSGIWWLDPATGPGPGLTIPALPASGWVYEGWVVVNGTPVSTGTFSTASGADASAPFSGTEAGPAYPGEDFLINAPSGLTFPLSLAGGAAVISVEPVPDNSTAPFLLKPIQGMIPSTATDHTLYNAENKAADTNPSGTVSQQ